MKDGKLNTADDEDMNAVRALLTKLFPNSPALVAIIMLLLKAIGAAVLIWFGIDVSGVV